MQYEMVQDVKIVFGAGCLANLPEVVRDAGGTKALIVTDKGIVSAGIAGKVEDVLKNAGIPCVLFDGVQPDPNYEVVAAGDALRVKENCDLVIGLGGGSSLDSSKAINLLRFNEGPILRYADPATPMKAAPHLVVIPTTAGTGSELSDGLVITDEKGDKRPILATLASSEFAVIDPELMVGMPPHITASTGMDALSHGMESYTSTAATLFTDQITLRIMELVHEWLPVAVKDGSNIEARSNMAVACTLAGWMLRYGHTNAGHSIAHALGNHFHIPHGFACAYALPVVLGFNAPASPAKTRKVGEIFGATFTGSETPEEIGVKAKNAVIAFRESLGLKKAGDWGADKAEFPKMTDEIVNDLFQSFNVRKMGEQDAISLLEEIFA